METVKTPTSEIRNRTEQTGTTELPSMKNMLMQPKTLLVGLIISAVLNVVLLGATLSLASGTEQPTPTTVPIATRAPSPVTTQRPSPTPTNTPDEQDSALRQCFDNCIEADAIERLATVSSDVEFFKATSIVNNLENKRCFGVYTKAKSPNDEFSSHFYPQSCNSGSVYNPPLDQIRIGSDIYFRNLSDAWDEGSVTPLGLSKLSSLVKQLKNQQNHSSEYTEINNIEVRNLIGISKSVNEFNQLVETTVTVSINDNFEVISYQIDEEDTYLETGHFFDYGIENVISKPN